MKFKLFFAWYDIWIGAFIDRPKKRIYICLIPMVVLMIEYGIRIPGHYPYLDKMLAIDPDGEDAQAHKFMMKDDEGKLLKSFMDMHK